MIAVDTETHLISSGRDGRPPGNCAPRLVCMSVSWPREDGSRTDILVHREPVPGMCTWQDNAAAALNRGTVGFNFAYDAGVMMAADPEMIPIILDAYAADRVTDVMIRQKLADIATGRLRLNQKWFVKGPHRGCRVVKIQGEPWSEVSYSLAAVTKRLLGVDLEKGGVQLQYESLTNTPVAYWPEAARQYAVNDARVTLDNYFAQQNWPDEYRQARAALWIHLMYCWGLRTDQPAVRRLEEQVRAEHAQLGRRLVEKGLARIEKGELVRNMKEAQTRIAAAYALKGQPYPTTDGGSPALHREACENSGNPDLVAYAEYTALNTELSKDISALKATIIHSRFESLVNTGRISSSDPNVTNLPRRPGVRECFIPRPGHVFICADFKGLELATLAQVCYRILGRSSLGDALNAGLDPHLMIAEDILGWPYATLDAIKTAGPQADHTGRGCHCAFCTQDNGRQCGKVANFGLPGGLGWEALIHFAKQNYGVDLTEHQSKGLKVTWFRRWPEMPDYLNLIGQVVRTRGFIEQIFSQRLRGDVGFTDGCNTMFQGLGSDVAKDAGWDLMCEQYDARRRSPLYGCRTVNFPHDEFVIETPEDRIGPVARRIRQIMVEAGKRWLPDVKLDADVTAMRRYSKKPTGDNKVAIPA